MSAEWILYGDAPARRIISIYLSGEDTDDLVHMLDAGSRMDRPLADDYAALSRRLCDQELELPRPGRWQELNRRAQEGISSELQMTPAEVELCHERALDCQSAMAAAYGHEHPAHRELLESLARVIRAGEANSTVSSKVTI